MPDAPDRADTLDDLDHPALKVVKPIPVVLREDDGLTIATIEAIGFTCLGHTRDDALKNLRLAVREYCLHVFAPARQPKSHPERQALEFLIGHVAYQPSR